MSDPRQHFDDLLARVACEVVLAAPHGPVDGARALLAELQALVSRSAWSDREALDRSIASALTCTDARAMGAAIDVLSLLAASPTASPRGADAGDDGAGPTSDDDLAVLRSDAELAGMFLDESLDHLRSIEAVALQLEHAPDDANLLDELFRPFHTVKGNAGALGVTPVQELAHAVENLLDLARSGRRPLDAAGIELVLQSVDLLTAMVRDIQGRLAGATTPSRRAERERMIAALEQLTNAETHAPIRTSPSSPSPAPAASARSADGDDHPRVWRTRADDRPGHSAVKVDTRKLDTLVDMVGELVIVQSIINEDPALQAVLGDRLARHLSQLRRITSDLQRTAMSMRLVPIRQTFGKMSRLVRDLGRQSGKAIDLVLSGEGTELDRRLVESINDPLMHMIRNSVDHGIESPDARAAAGKPRVGRLSLSASHQGGHVIIQIADDGRGLDTARIHARAVAQGLIHRDAVLTAADVHALIFRPGFSTAEQVTEISGRGVGMDVVRRNIEALRGRVDIDSTPGRGTTFTIRLPLTLAIVDGLLLRVGGERFVLPTFSVWESLRPSADQVHDVQGRPRMVRVRDTLLPLVRLADVFGVAGAEADATAATVVVIEDDGRRVALQVDQLVGKQEVVIKALGAALGPVRGVAGAAILGDGRVGLILDAHGLVALHAGTTAAA